MKKLLIVESPNKINSIKKYLNDDYIVKASYGHITDLGKGGHFGIGVDIENNFKPKYVLIDEKIKVLEDLINAAKECDEILIGSDPDREGTGIAWHLCERLKDLNKSIKRIEIYEITKKGIQEAISKPRDINIPIFKSQEARRILDRLVGFTASPFLMSFYGNNLSAGRVQSVISRIIVQREREIESFIPEEYWVIKANLQNKDGISFAAKYDKKVSDSAEANRIKNILEGNNLNSIFEVQKVESPQKKEKPNPPLITTRLQQILSKEHGLKPDETMKAAQTLYEQGYITYMRTDSIRISDDAVKAAREYLKDKGFEIPKKSNTFKNKDAAQDAHECIRPTDLNTEPSSPEFSGDEKLVYEAIFNHFLSSQMNPAVYSTLKVSILLKNDPSIVLKATGKALIDPGYLKIFGTNDQSKIDIPNLVEGENLTLSSSKPISSEQKFTQPPPRYSYDSLIKVLEDKSIGRPATMAELLSKITHRNYVYMNGNVFHPTELGKKITDELTKSFSFMDYDFSAELEKKLDEIAESKTDQLKMLNDFFKPFQNELNKAYLDHGTPLCEKCESPMIKRTSKAGKDFLACTSLTRCKNTKSIET